MKDPSLSDFGMQTRDSFRHDGRNALVTGGASGIGEATGKELSRAGAICFAEQAMIGRFEGEACFVFCRRWRDSAGSAA